MTRTTDLRRALEGRLDLWQRQRQQRRHDRAGEFEFIHINKTGGSSIEKGLGLPFHHYTAVERVERLGAIEWNRRYSFTFVRNPWDRLVSQYHHRDGRGRLRDDVAFTEWVRRTLVERDRDLMFRPEAFINQVEWISGSSGELLVDDVYRFESLHADFDSLCRELGTTAALPHVKSSRHRHYSYYFDDASAEIVRDVYARDIDAFGYSFEQTRAQSEKPSGPPATSGAASSADRGP